MSTLQHLGGPSWTATEALTWIAFREPEPWAAILSRRDTFIYRWGSEPPAKDTRGVLEVAAGLPCSMACDREGDPTYVRGRADYLLSVNRSVTTNPDLCFIALHVLFVAAIEEFHFREAEINKASAILLAGIAAGQVLAYCIGQEQPIGRAVGMWPVCFKQDCVVPHRDASPDQTIAILSGKQYKNVCFNSLEVKRLLLEPSSDFLPREAKTKRHSGLDYRTADAPLVAEAIAGIEAGTYKTATDAARALCGRAVGSRNESSRMTRLLTRITATLSQSVQP